MSLENLWPREEHKRIQTEGQTLYRVAFEHASKSDYTAQSLIYGGAQFMAAGLATLIKKNGVGRFIPMLQAAVSLLISMLSDALEFLDDKDVDNDKQTHH